MTSLEIFGLVAPVIIVTLVGLGAWWVVRH
jgi:hypothetical protein